MATLKCTLVHHTGTIIRFTTSQLGELPDSDQDVQIELPNGSVVHGHFRRNEANPNVSGAELVGYIKGRLAFGEREDAQITLGESDLWKLRTN
jgi:hypothetical protein